MIRWLSPLFVFAACAAAPAIDKAPKEDFSDAATYTAEEGPVQAVVEVSPKEPKLGDALSVRLTVTAEAKVTVDMPPFGEALGRFQVVDYRPRRKVLPDGSTTHVQFYTLQAEGSGKQRLPSLRIEFVDEREGNDSSEPKELLTEEIEIEVSSALPEGVLATDLRPPKGQLEDTERALLWARWGGALGALLLLVVLVAVSLRVRRTKHRAASVAAHVAALAHLNRLANANLDSEAYYVELSGIVRRYLEARFRLRAPELTTEEFLREARRSAQLSDQQRSQLGTFLSVCDRVKFAGFEPPEEQRAGDMEIARQFVMETRLVEEAAS